MARRGVTVTAEGVEDLLRRLDVLPARLRDRYLDDAVRAGSETLVEFMRALAPRGDGPTHAYKFIEAHRDDRRSRPEKAEYVVGPTGVGFYLTFHETGTRFMPASPFMVPAMVAGRDEIIADVRKSLSRSLRPGLRV